MRAFGGKVSLPPDFFPSAFEGVYVNHPTKDYRIKCAAGLLAGTFRGNAALEAEFCPIGLFAGSFRWHAEIRVEMPLGDTQRHTGIQLLLSGPPRHGVHCADQVIAGFRLFVEQRRGARGIEGESL